MPLVVARPPCSVLGWGPPLLSVVVVFVHCPGCCDAAAMSNPVFAATWDWGLFGLYVLVVLRFEHERSVTELVMIIDGELAVSECWLTPLLQGCAFCSLGGEGKAQQQQQKIL